MSHTVAAPDARSVASPSPLALPPDALALSIEDAVKATSLCRKTLFSAMRKGELKARKYGRRTLIVREDLKAFVDALPVAREG